MHESCIITVVDGYEVRFYFKDGILDKVYKIKHGFIISKFKRKQRKRFKKIIKYYLKFFLENDTYLFTKICEFTDDNKLIVLCKDIVVKENIELFYTIKEATKKRDELIKIRSIYFNKNI